MSDTPDDIRERAREVCRSLEAMPSEGNIKYIETALLAVDRAARLEERERCAKLVENDVHDTSVRLNLTRHKNLADWFAEQRAAAIRSSE